MKTKCYSVNLKSLVSISDKAYIATDYSGNEAILPKSQVIGDDYSKDNAYFISEWILRQKNLVYSFKKEYWFDEFGNELPVYQVKKHIPKKINNKETIIDADLIR